MKLLTFVGKSLIFDFVNVGISDAETLSVPVIWPWASYWIFLRAAVAWAVTELLWLSVVPLLDKPLPAVSIFPLMSDGTKKSESSVRSVILVGMTPLFILKTPLDSVNVVSSAVYSLNKSLTFTYKCSLDEEKDPHDEFKAGDQIKVEVIKLNDGIA